VALSLHKKRMTCAISSGFGHVAKSAFGIARLFVAVSMMLGRIEFTLTPDGENTRLRLVESGFQQIDWPEQRRTDTVNDHEKGWDGHLARLRECAS